MPSIRVVAICGGLLGVAGGSFPVTTLEHLRSVRRALNAWVIPRQVAIPSARSAFVGGEFVDSSLEERVAWGSEP